MTRVSAGDAALAGALVVLGVAESLLSDGVTGPRWAAALATAALCLLLLWRRSHPVATAVLLTAILLPTAAWLVDPSEVITAFLPVLVLAYGGALHAGPRGSRLVLALLVAAVSAIGLIDDTHDASNVYFPVTIVVLCWLAGRTVRLRARHAGELHEAAALAAERREQAAQEAVAAERRRIAREMHDVVAHSISLMVVQAGGARRILRADPARAEEAAARIRAAGLDALAEMDLLLGVLETSPQEAAPALADLPGLIDRARAAGLPVTLETVGEPRPLGPGAELAVYRVVQEALTNAIKHAGGATTVVRLTWGENTLALRVADDGDGGPSPELAGAGHGLLGMGERLRVHGGDVNAGPRPGGGFEVAARLPYERQSTAPVASPLSQKR